MADNQNKPPEKEKTIEELLNRDRDMMRSPLLWFALLVIPVMCTLYGAFFMGGSPAAEPKPVIAYTPDHPAPAQVSEDDGGARRGANPACGDYSEQVGKPADEALQAQLKADNRAFRILPPGSMMTMDHSPGRVNFDVDADGKITRAWCG
jgi:hypothetical protein